MDEETIEITPDPKPEKEETSFFKVEGEIIVHDQNVKEDSLLLVNNSNNEPLMELYQSRSIQSYRIQCHKTEELEYFNH
ncbi:MAG: hypothetical protein ACKVJF_12865 [Flavobacteriales bacterium]